MNNELLVGKCLFCGGDLAVFRENEQVDETHIYCMRCYVHTQTYKTREDAVSAWNKRCKELAKLSIGEESEAIMRTRQEIKDRVKEVQEKVEIYCEKLDNPLDYSEKQNKINLDIYYRSCYELGALEWVLDNRPEMKDNQF